MRFCPGCGLPLEASDNAALAAPRAYTPPHLAERILASRGALEGERKQVTVLFADVKGSMELAEQLDPEDWRGMMDQFFHLLADGVHRFEGTVIQFTGDGIMALFGAPIAHEDHAQRACWAALHLQTALRRHAQELRRARSLDFHVRIGLNSGDVVVGTIGDDLRMEYTAQGHTVGLAQRIEQLAEPGRAYLSSATAALVQGYFALEDLGEFSVKGVSTALRVYALEGVGALRSRLDVSRARGLTRFVGRDDDLRGLEAALETARAGNGQVVGIVAPAGVGKSRLCFEFLERCRARGMAVIEGRAVAHGRDIPLLPILQVFRAYFAIGEQDSDATAREKIAGRLVLVDDSFRDVLPLLFDFLGVTDPDRPAPRMDPETRQRQLFDLTRRLLRSGQGDTITLLEDLHWIDRGSEAFLAQWVEAVGGARRLLVLNFRPEYHADWMQKSYSRQLALAPLGPEAIRELLDHLLGGDASVSGLAAKIHAETAGNPFFTEEVVQSLIESGHLAGTPGAYRLVRPLDTIRVPPTVQALLASRIDRLGAREKRVLETAAVIGKEFAEPILAAVAELPPEQLAESVAKLTAAEFVYEQELFPFAVYAFKHPLTQEVALGSQLHERRRRTHAAVARALEEAHSGRLDEQAALIAYHCEEAGNALDAARWHARAAQWIVANDYVEAVAHWRRVDRLLDGVAESTEVIALRARACARILALASRVSATEEEENEASAIFARGRDLLARHGDAAALAVLTTSYGIFRIRRTGALDEYLERTREAVALADRGDDVAVRAAVRPDHVFALLLEGRFAESLGVCNEILTLIGGDARVGDAFFGWSPLVLASFFSGWALTNLGRLVDAEVPLRQALRVAQEHGPPESVFWTHLCHAFHALARGDADLTMTAVRRALEEAARSGTHTSTGLAHLWLGVAHLASEDWSSGVEALERYLMLDRERRGYREWEPYALSALSRAHLGHGDAPLALETAAEATALARRRGTGLWLLDALLAEASALRAARGLAARDDAEALLAEVWALVEETGGRRWLPDVHLERAAWMELLGDTAARHRELAEAERLLLEMGAPLRARKVVRERERGGRES
jgi:class 3 adenylate cyclase/tetratricopeptide (TPR) repeat protein